MRLLSALGCAALALLAASPATAQVTGSNLSGQRAQEISPPRINLPSPRDRIDGEESMRLVAECAERNVPGMVNAYIATMPGSREEDRIYTVLEDRLRRCILPKFGGLSFGGESLRAALAGAVYRHEFPADPDFSRAGETSLPSAWTDFVKSATNNRRDYYNDAARRLILLQDVGDCLVDANAPAASRLIRSLPTSAGERAAFNELGSKVGPCLPNGVTFRVGAGPLRAYVAEGLLRKARASVSAVQGGATSNDRTHQ
jgi:hypothetical protein